MTTDLTTTAEPLQAGQRRAEFGVPVLFTITAFVGASLLFVVQPMVAKLLLPFYGGSATVWSTSSLLFQVLLLAAYLYSDFTTRRLGSRLQPRVHVLVLLLPLLALPLALPASVSPPADSSPALWLLRTLLVMVGLPFVVVATTGPLLQRWYSWSNRMKSEDPYFLFAASNLGSFGGLLAYPLLIEPRMSLDAQRSLWTWGFGVFAALCALSALAVTVRASGTLRFVVRPSRAAVAPLKARVLARWTFLAFLPSSLMLGVTAHISTDVAAIPLLWVVPLAIYLGTFVVAFGKGARQFPAVGARIAVALTPGAVLLAASPGLLPVWAVVGIDLVVLALVAHVAHSRLAAERPPPEYLTRFFLIVATGGALGGLLNGLLAPVLFETVLEYQLALVMVPLLALGFHDEQDRISRYVAGDRARLALVIAGTTLLALLALLGMALMATSNRQETPALVAAGLIALFVVGFGVARLPSVALAVCVVLYGVPVLMDSSDTLVRERSFYGSYRVYVEGDQHVLAHGTTIHGSQFVDSARRRVPTTYYSVAGPLGQVFDTLDTNAARFERVGVVGLGAGAIAAYGRAGQAITFYEIDPGVVDIARDPALFTYLSDSAADVTTKVGDGRLLVGRAPSEEFNLLVMDAFSSDSIPVHLLTEEAVDVYAEKLANRGILMFHISNRVFDLKPVMAGLAEHLGWEVVVGNGRNGPDGATGSEWVVLSADTAAVDAMRHRGWVDLDATAAVSWTDDYSSILSVLR